MDASKVCEYRSQWGREIVDEIEQADVKEGIALWHLGGASIGIRTRDAVAYVDLYTGPSVAGVHRMCAVPLDPRDVGRCDVLISTHDHEDHCDRDSMLPIWEKTRCRVVGPTSSARLMKQWGIGDEHISALQPGKSVKVADLSITALPSNDWEDEEAVTYVVETEGARVFVGGDTTYFDGLAAIGEEHDIDIALLSLGTNPPDQGVFMEADDVVRAGLDLRAKVIVPVHWDMWKEYLADPEDVVRAAERMKVDADVRILRLGDRLDYPPEPGKRGTV